MTAISLRQRVFEATGMTDLSGGFWHSVVNPYYRQSLATRELYPYLVPNEKTKVSIAATLEGFRIPTAFNTASYYPEDAGGAWSHEFNGMAASDTHWYLTSNTITWFQGTVLVDVGVKLYYMPLTGDLNGNGAHVLIPDSLKNGYIHFGDPSYWKPQEDTREFILVPCDHRPGFGEVDLCLAYEITTSGIPQYRGQQPVEQPEILGGDLDATAWCAVSPVKDVYYCSEFCENALVIYPFIPSITQGNEFSLKWPDENVAGGIAIREKDGSPAQVYRVQGGTVSTRGHLYISSDVQKSQGGGIRLIEMASGTLQDFQLNMKGEYQSTGEGCTGGELEYQGMCIKDMDQVSHHGSVSGQIHFALLNNDIASSDNVTMAHFTITDANEKPWI